MTNTAFFRLHNGVHQDVFVSFHLFCFKWFFFCPVLLFYLSVLIVFIVAHFFAILSSKNEQRTVQFFSCLSHFVFLVVFRSSSCFLFSFF